VPAEAVDDEKSIDLLFFWMGLWRLLMLKVRNIGVLSDNWLHRDH
jgi:hypothetical protein